MNFDERRSRLVAEAVCLRRSNRNADQKPSPVEVVVSDKKAEHTVADSPAEDIRKADFAEDTERAEGTVSKQVLTSFQRMVISHTADDRYVSKSTI